MMRNVTLLAGLSSSLLLTACAGNSGNYPSLAIRDVERARPAAQPESEPAPPPSLSADLDSRIARLVSDARQAHGQFSAQSASTSRAVASARGSSAPSDRWIEASAALAGLQAKRSQAVISLAEIDRHYADERLANPEGMTPTAEALFNARETVSTWIAEEDRVIRRLSEQLGA